MSDDFDRQYEVIEWRDGQAVTRFDLLANEVAVAIQINGISQAVMMATPIQLDAFAVGFCLSEGIVSSQSEIYGVDALETEQGWVLEVDIATQRQQQLAARRRHMSGRSGCGLCGIDSIDAVRTCAKPLNRSQRFSHQIIQSGLENFDNMPEIATRSGAMHHAAWINNAGNFTHMSHDVGRHNALDKLIGLCAQQQTQTGYAMMSSRASHELVEKCATVGIEMLVCVSGATSLAVTRARQLGLTLVGFARRGRHIVYSGGDYLD